MGLVPDFFFRVSPKDISNIMVFRAFSSVILGIGTIVTFMPCEFIQPWIDLFWTCMN